MISINFASKNYRLLERAHIGMLAVALLLGITLLGMIWAAVSLRMHIASVERDLKQRKAAVESVQPLLQERERLVKQLSTMSGLVDARKFSWTKLLSGLETVVPVGVGLKTIDYNPANRSLALDGVASSPEALRNLIGGLERSPLFKEPFLKHQSLEKGSISFNVVVVYR